ncbi:O-antigen ligase family protein [Falsihalocynthiibacter sp. S25ZX9]|uniref:O-antigen ligase family protein n=1 Tax=Falsihalocynthiibacter sp. S25ZX9 TaxID=3240870 RepID=UPI00350F2778
MAILLLLYVVVLSVKTPARKLRSRAVWPAFALGIPFVIYALLQALPLGPLNLKLPNDLQLYLPSDYISLTPAATALGALRISGYGVLFFLIFETATRQSLLKRMAWALFLGISLHAAWSMVALKLLGDVTLVGEKTAYLGSATGTFINRNSFATFLGMGLCLGLAMILDRSNKLPSTTTTIRLETALLWMCLALTAIALVSTQSRMGVFATTLGTSVVIYRMRPAKTWFIYAVILLPLILLFAGNLAERALFSLIDSEGRRELWAQSFELIKIRPFTGFGLDAFSQSFALQHAPPLAQDVVWEYAHNSYLTLWIQGGVFFGSLPLLALLWGGTKLVRAPNLHDPIATSALAILVLAGTHSLVDFSLEMQANAFLFTAIFAMGLAAVQPRKNHSIT